MRPGELASLLQSGLSLRQALGTGPIPAGIMGFAISSGAPLVPILLQLDRQEIGARRAQSELDQALAVPRATRKLLIWLPALSLVFAQFLGLTSLAAFTNPLVMATSLLAVALLIVGSRITGRQLSQAQSELEVTSLQEFLICVSAGMSLAEIRASRPGLMNQEQVARLTRLSFATGAALIPLIQGEIERSIADQLSLQIEKLRQLSVRILIPLGLTTLPAFLLFTIPPILVGSLR